jgi:hypothetical protein
MPDDLLALLHEVRDAFRQLLQATGADPGKTRETARALDLDRNLVWKITRVVNAPDILAAACEIPSQNQIAKLCRACECHGASLELAERVREISQRFETVVNEVFDDRESLIAVAAGLDYDDVTRRQEDMRRQTFYGNSSIWGVQARVNFKTTIHAPSVDDPRNITTARLEGLVQFRRLRPVPWPLHREHGYHDDGRVMSMVSHAVDPEVTSPESLPLVPRFCTEPLPKLQPIKTSYGRRIEIPAGPLGNTGALTCVFADVFKPDFPRYRTEDSFFLSAMIDLVTPSELLIFDMFLHRDLEHQGPPETILLDRLSLERGYTPANEPHQKLPLSVRALPLGGGTAGATTPRYPDYPRLLEHVYGCLGWRAEEFRGYRFLMHYPPVPTAVVLKLKSPDPPGD